MKQPEQRSETKKTGARILLINLHSSKNAGDAALAITAIQQLKENFPGSEIILSMNEKDSHTGSEPLVDSFLYFFKGNHPTGRKNWNLLRMLSVGITSLLTAIVYQISKKIFIPTRSESLKKLLQAYCSADLVVSAPGNFIYSSGKMGATVLVVLYSMLFALFLKKPLYLLPQSIGPLRYPWEKWLLKSVLNKARVIMVREPESMRFLQNIQFTHPNIHLIPDLAFRFEGAPIQDAQKWLAKNGVSLVSDRPLLGITTINWDKQNPDFKAQSIYETAILNAARMMMTDLKGKVIFFPQVCGNMPATDDRIPASRIHNQLSAFGDRIVLINQPASAEILKTAYGLMDVFIGTRMHSNIFALGGGVPVIAIAYRHKTQGLMNLLELSEWVIDIEKIDAQQLQDYLKRIWKEKQRIRSMIEKRIPELASQASQAGRMIATDFLQYSQRED